MDDSDDSNAMAQDPSADPPSGVDPNADPTDTGSSDWTGPSATNTGVYDPDNPQAWSAAYSAHESDHPSQMEHDHSAITEESAFTEGYGAGLAASQEGVPRDEAGHLPIPQTPDEYHEWNPDYQDGYSMGYGASEHPGDNLYQGDNYDE